MPKTSQSILKRFVGPSRKEKLIESLKSQTLVAGKLEIARLLANQSELLDLPAKSVLMEQGGSDDDIFFIISGSVSVLVNGREVAKRQVGEHVGEMALVDTTAVRSATVVTAEHSVIAKISEPRFTKIADKFPEIWRRMANCIAKRLRERNRYHVTPRNQPVVFIGSSSEGLPIAKCICSYLKKHPIIPVLWSEGVFELSKTTIEDLLRQSTESDFAIIVFSPDDITTSRRQRKIAPRDNVVFELGLFLGALKRERTLIVSPNNVDIKIPSDLLGVTRLQYTNKKGISNAKALGSVNGSIKKHIIKYGPI